MGIGLFLNSPPQVGSSITIELKLDGKTIKLNGQVRWRIGDKSSNQTLVKTEFIAEGKTEEQDTGYKTLEHFFDDINAIGYNYHVRVQLYDRIPSELFQQNDINIK